MNLFIEIWQGNTLYKLERKYEFEEADFKKIIGKSCNEVFSFYQKSQRSGNKNIFKATQFLNLRITYNGCEILDTRDRRYDAFRSFLKLSNDSKSKRDFAKNLYFAYSLIVDSESENDIELNFSPKVYKEGRSKKVTTNNYERNKKARQLCLNYHGYRCKVCDFDFFDTYGVLGLNYIQVHHIIPVSEITKTYTINPIKDLIPLCANCHAMVHRKKKTLSIEELKEKIAQANK